MSVPARNRPAAGGWRFRAGRCLPVQPAGDHQMQHQKEIILERHDDPLADAAIPRDSFAVGFRQWRVNRPHQKGMCDAYLPETLADGSLLQRFDIDGYVGEFRHSAITTRGR